MIEKKENEFERAMRISQNAADIGFDFEDHLGPIDKIREELGELLEVIEHESDNESRLTDELGDILFSVINLARKIGVDPSLAIRNTNMKFQHRFSHVEKMIRAHGPVDLEQMEGWWCEAKEREHD